MPVPGFTIDGVLPPYVGPRGPGDNPAYMSPYRVGVREVVARFATSPERRAILEGWLKYRQELRSVGITDGFQWLDGSFLEDVEQRRGNPPNDLDLTVFVQRPAAASSDADFQNLVSAHPNTFSRSAVKARHRLDVLRVDLNSNVEDIVRLTRYYALLFSHTRAEGLWKGMLEVSQSDSLDENALLSSLSVPAAGSTP